LETIICLNPSDFSVRNGARGNVKKMSRGLVTKRLDVKARALDQITKQKFISLLFSFPLCIESLHLLIADLSLLWFCA